MGWVAFVIAVVGFMIHQSDLWAVFRRVNNQERRLQELERLVYEDGRAR